MFTSILKKISPNHQVSFLNIITICLFLSGTPSPSLKRERKKCNWYALDAAACPYGFKLLVIIFNFTISLHSSSCCICLHTICHKEMEKMEELIDLHFWCIECHTTLPDWRYFGLACRVSREFHQFIAISHAEECCLTPRWQLTNK